jgi:hypothetical protein
LATKSCSPRVLPDVLAQARSVCRRL